MKKILLDTQALYWWSVELPKLGNDARELIIATDEVYVSTISLFELLQKQRAGKLSRELDLLSAEFVGQFELQSPNKSALNAYRQLPPLSWKDPFDHLLMAQAIAAGACLITADRQILTCQISGLRTLDAQK